MRFPRLKITKGRSQFKRWSIETALNFPEKVFRIPSRGNYIVIVKHPIKALLIEYPGKYRTFSAKQAIEVLERLYKMTGDPEKQWIEMVED